jgi:hypothetical protein
LSGEIEFKTLSAALVEGTVRDLRENEICFAGFKPGSTYNVATTSNGRSEKIVTRVDKEGGLRFKFVPFCGFSLTRVAE